MQYILFCAYDSLRTYSIFIPVRFIDEQLRKKLDILDKYSITHTIKNNTIKKIIDMLLF